MSVGREPSLARRKSYCQNLLRFEPCRWRCVIYFLVLTNWYRVKAISLNNLNTDNKFSDQILFNNMFYVFLVEEKKRLDAIKADCRPPQNTLLFILF